MSDEIVEKAIAYHAQDGRPGKLATEVTKPTGGQSDLSLAYSPGVGYVSSMVADGVLDVDDVTNRGNTVAVVSDGSAVLGLGDIGPKAGLPVMEGKVVLNKKFADIDGMALSVSTRLRSMSSAGQAREAEDPVEAMVDFVKRLEPSVGAVNLEDIKAPDCFEIEERLKVEMNIPVFHDDQHGTAIITLAALLRSLELTERKIEKVKVVVVGAGAAAIACSRLWVSAGVKKECLTMVDSKGVITEDRCGCACDDVNEYKCEFSTGEDMRSLNEAIKGADVFLGLSKKGVLTSEMVKKMTKDPIVFALANPDPEIGYDEAVEAGAKIVATGRSDHPNQVNNVLGFPGIFRGALDCKASEINEAMKIAAAGALNTLATEEIPKDVLTELQKAYPNDDFSDEWTHVIPKAFDPRVVPRVARAVVEAAMKSGVAQLSISDLDNYESGVANRIR
jgi:malate dehydrogenase (oxaloacetate-decarboxylating)(NADP+)